MMGAAAEIARLREALERGFVVRDLQSTQKPAPVERMTHEQHIRAVSVDRAIESLAASSGYRTDVLLRRADDIAKFVTDGTVPSGQPATE